MYYEVKIKVSVAERIIRTLRNKMFKMFQYRRSYRFLENLQDLVESYNNTPHKTLGDISPKDITKDNEAEIWDQVYNKLSTKRRGKHKLKAFKEYNFKLEIWLGWQALDICFKGTINKNGH